MVGGFTQPDPHRPENTSIDQYMPLFFLSKICLHLETKVGSPSLVVPSEQSNCFVVVIIIIFCFIYASTSSPSIVICLIQEFVHLFFLCVLRVLTIRNSKILSYCHLKL